MIDATKMHVRLVAHALRPAAGSAFGKATSLTDG
jgi:hypothetical protein